MATIIGSNCPAVQNGTPAGTVNNTSTSFPKFKFFLHMWVIKRGIRNTCGYWGWASRSSPNNSSAISITAGAITHNLTACMSLSSNMVSGVTSSKGIPPQSFPILVLHQLQTHDPTAPEALSSAPLLKGRKEKGSAPASIPYVKSPLERPSTPVAFILFPEMWSTRRMKPPSLSALCSLKTMSFNLALGKCPL